MLDETADSEDDSDSPNYIGKNSALLVLTSHKQDPIMEKFRKELHDKRIQFVLEKPFRDSIEIGGRSIWFLNFQEPIDRMKKLIFNFDQKKVIKFMPVENCLQVTADKILEDNKI